MKTLNVVSSFGNSSGRISEIIKYNDYTFKIFAEVRNGGTTLTAQLMDNSGIFQYVLGSVDVDFSYTASYVSNEAMKKSDLSRAIIAMKKVITKVY